MCVGAKHGKGVGVGVRLTSRVRFFVNSEFGLSRCCFILRVLVT